MASPVYAKVFADVVAAMERGIVPWHRPWSSDAASMPHNAITGRPYSGGNVIALMFAGMSYQSTGWLTFKQAIGAGCVVRKGEKGTAVYFMSKAVSKKGADEEERGTYFFAKGFTVFNIEQLDELQPGSLDILRAKNSSQAPRSTFERLEEAERIVEQSRANIHHGGDRACYIPSADLIKMPEQSAFESRETYYGTLFHELTHWTGAKDRLDRLTPAKFGSPEYAFEELVAELGAAFTCAQVGIDTVSQSAAYLTSWTKACREHPDLLPRAASYAQRAVNFLTSVEEATVEVVA